MHMLANLLYYLIYFGVDIFMLLLAGWLYVRFTPYDEIQMIRDGNTAAAVAIGGAMLGYAVVIFTLTTLISSIIALVVWSFIALGVQIAAFELVQYVVMRDNLKAQMERGDLAHGVFLGAFSLAVGILNAACLHP